jgi:outer membrane protein
MDQTNTTRVGMKRKYLLLALLVAGAIIAKGQQKTLTLKECIDTALANNFTIKQRELQANTAAINYKQAKDNLLPSAQSTYSYSINNGRTIDPFTNGYITQQLKSSNADVSASVPVFSGFQLRNTIRLNEQAFAGARMEWQQRKDELTLQVILAYLQVLSTQDAIALATQQAGVTKQQVERIDIVGKEGATAPSNVSDLKGQYAGEQINLISAENNYQSSVLALTQLMQVPYNEQLQFSRSGLVEEIKQFETMPDEIYALALQKLAAVKAADFRVSSSVMAVKAAKGAYYPTVALFGGASTNYSSAAMLNSFVSSADAPTGAYVQYNGSNLPVLARQDVYKSTPIGYGSQFNNNISYGFGVSMRIPLLNSFRVRNAVKLAKNDELNSRLIADNIKLQLRQNIDQAYININAVSKRYGALQEQAAAYTESFRIAALRFENGVINSPEYLIAKNNLDRVNGNLIIAKYEYMLRKKVLEFYMGQL